MYNFIGIDVSKATLQVYIPKANRQELTALSGLDAIEITSGSSIQRKSRISKKGSAIYRSMLFMPDLKKIQNIQQLPKSQ